MSIFDDKQIDLDLNGPVLSFTTNPTGVGSTGVGINSTGGGTVSLIGIATATFPTSANNTGYVTYRWHEEGVGALSDSTYVTGTATTTLTLSNLITPTDDGRKFFLQADYVPSYYVTGNAINEPFNSGVGTVTVDPLIEIIAQPTSATTITDQSVTFALDASLTNNGTDLAYQWQLDGSDVTDGTVTKSTVAEVEGTTDNIITQTTYTTATYTIPANVTNVRFDVAGGAGGNGGGAGGYLEGGDGGAAITQWFSLPTSTSARTVRFVVGKKGNDGATGGHSHAHGASGDSNGGTSGNGHPGSGCAGGAGGGSTGVYLDNLLVAVLGGGGGGGGGGLGGTPEDGGGYLGGGEGLIATTSGITKSGGGGGQSGGDGEAGGGGGGGGADPQSEGGSDGTSGRGGGRGGSAYRSDYLTILGGSRNPNGSGWGALSYVQGQTVTTSVQNVTRTTTISGSTSKSLTLSTDGPGIGYTVCTSVSSATASNSPIKSDIVDYQVIDSQEESIIVIEAIGVDSTATVSQIDLNADDDGDVEISPSSQNVDNNIFTQFYSLYARDRDLDVEMDLYGGMGTSYGLDENGSPTRVVRTTGITGGEGGFSRIRFTMKQNEEYVIAGLIDSIRTPFVYRKGALMACVGEGGHGTQDSYGGPGGGVNTAGENGFGWEGSQPGGDLIPAGALTLNGIFGSSFIAPTLYPGDAQAGTPAFLTEGGRTIRCTKGVYWAQQGIAPCDDISGSTQFRLSDGTVVTNTANITRGFKAGYNIMQTAGKALGFKGARGGNGATGGVGGTNNSGGGGSGYTDGSVTVVDTKLGGSTEEPKILLRMQS